MTTILVVDAANVVGSRPDGWWKDRAGAARRLHEGLLVADTPYDVVVLVARGCREGRRPGGPRRPRPHRARPEGRRRHHRRAGAGRRRPRRPVTVVTADRMLQARVRGLGALALGPSWLLDQL